MKMTLTQSIIINKLSIDVKPDLDQQGRVVYLPNPERKPYIITDNHRDSPVGFGVKISATKKPISFNDGWHQQTSDPRRVARHRNRLSDLRLVMFQILPTLIRLAMLLANSLKL